MSLGSTGGFPPDPHQGSAIPEPWRYLSGLLRPTKSATMCCSSSNSRIPPRVFRRNAPSLLTPFCLRLLAQQAPYSPCSLRLWLHCAWVREELALLVSCGSWGSRDGDYDGIPLNPQKYLQNRGKATLGLWAAHLRIALGGLKARPQPKVSSNLTPLGVYRLRGNPVVVAVA